MNFVAAKVDKVLGKHEVMEGQGPPLRSKDVMMKAVTWEGTKKVKVSTLGKPLITDSKDVILKVTACCICSGSDSHVYCKEIPGLEPGFTLGHECCGVVDEVGSEVTKHKVGDRVVVAFNIACGQCAWCKREEYSGCDLTNQSKLGDKFFGHAHGAIFGYGCMLGNVPGSQAEFVRVPIADVNCYPIPDSVPDEKALYLSDVLCTSLHAVEMGEVHEGDTVVIWGLGPIGLYTARWSQIRGAGRVIGVDLVPERLALAKEKFGIEVVDRSDLSSHELVQRLQEMVPDGADTVVEAVGFRFPTTTLHKIERAIGMVRIAKCFSFTAPLVKYTALQETDTADILTECMTVVRKYGRVSIIGDYCGLVSRFERCRYPTERVLFLLCDLLYISTMFFLRVRCVLSCPLYSAFVLSHICTSLPHRPITSPSARS
jgi:threonine dehydrogenase-like Zn-dependent dehydrogenase